MIIHLKTTFTTNPSRKYVRGKLSRKIGDTKSQCLKAVVVARDGDNNNPELYREENNPFSFNLNTIQCTKYTWIMRPLMRSNSTPIWLFYCGNRDTSCSWGRAGRARRAFYIVWKLVLISSRKTSNEGGLLQQPIRFAQAMPCACDDHPWKRARNIVDFLVAICVFSRWIWCIYRFRMDCVSATVFWECRVNRVGASIDCSSKSILGEWWATRVGASIDCNRNTMLGEWATPRVD